MGGRILKGVVIRKGEEYYTYLKKIFTGINNVQTNYNWLITSYECYPQNIKYAEKLSGRYCWLTGNELTEMIENEDFQWIWGTFSGFAKNISKHDIMQYELPKADGYERIWQLPLSIQHPLAEIEIIAWDSAMTILISKQDEIANCLLRNNLLAEELEKYNS